MVLGMRLEVIGKFVDPCGENSYLDVRGTGVLF